LDPRMRPWTCPSSLFRPNKTMNPPLVPQRPISWGCLHFRRRRWRPTDVIRCQTNPTAKTSTFPEWRKTCPRAALSPM
jgi:hypothetical protein